MKKMFAVMAEIFLGLSLVSMAAADEKMPAADYSIKGKVVSLDLLSRTLTISATETTPFGSGAGEFTFTMNDIISVRVCNQLKTVEDITIGETVTVEYHKEAGKLYADAVDIPTPLVACLLK